MKKIVIGIVIGVVVVAVLVLLRPPSTPVLGDPLTEQDYTSLLSEQWDVVVREFPAIYALVPYDGELDFNEWQAEVSRWVAIVRNVADDVVNVNPPASMAHIHAKYSQGMECWKTSTRLIEELVDKTVKQVITSPQQAQAIVDKAEAEMGKGTGLFLEARQLWEDFLKNQP